MAEIKGMWLQEPDPSTPDVVAVGHWKCEKCGVGRSIVTSTWPAVSLRFKCYCGTDVEITPAALIDGCQGSAKPNQSDGWDDACRCGHVRASHQMHVGRCTICECAQFDGSPSQSDGGLADA